MRTTLTLDDDVAALLQKENHRAGEPMKHTVNRALRTGLLLSKPAPGKRFVVRPFRTELTSAEWKHWGETKIEDDALLERHAKPRAS